MFNKFSLPWKIPITSIKNYFGEKVGLYFAFYAHYSYCLVLPALLGFACQVVVLVTDNYSHPVLPFYAVFMGVWYYNQYIYIYISV